VSYAVIPAILLGNFMVRLVLSYVCGSGQGSGLGLGVSLGGLRRGWKREDSVWVRKSHRHDVRSCD
jgi:hypothetical protein